MIWLLAACIGSSNAVRPASAVTIDCQGKDAEVAQDDQVVTLTGECRTLSVTGDRNRVTAEALTKVVVSGDGNVVVFPRWVERHEDLTVTGRDNVVKVGR